MNFTSMNFTLKNFAPKDFVSSLRAMSLDRSRLADLLAAAVVVSLPWSTSATSILVALWAAAAVAATCDGKALRELAAEPAAVLPVALVGLALAGTLWSEATAREAIAGLAPFLKLLAIPLLFLQFRRGGRSEAVLRAYLASAGVLLAVSWLIFLLPLWKTDYPGVPVKDYIFQSIEFTLCAFVLLDRAIASLRTDRTAALMLAGSALLFLADIVFVALGRTSIVIITVLFGLLGVRHFRRRALVAFAAAGVAIAASAWTASPYLRERVTHVIAELDPAHANLNETSAGIRVSFWKMSMKVIAEAPLLGHGTGSIAATFARAAAADPAAPGGATNPHNQYFAVAIQLGLLGALVLVAMWAAHLRMFLLPGAAAFVGLSLVLENTVGSLFNSHLSDFSHGWLYVLGIGIAGGAALRQRDLSRGEAGPPPARPD